jgi:Ca-activated chloride channel homolog
VTIDISGSMSSPDFGGGQTRIGAVKKVVHDFVGGLTNDRVGLVVFGNEALVLAPLTLDHAVVQRLADPLEANGRLVGGATAIGTGLATALNVMRDSTARSKVVILLTDGENNTGQIAPIDAARAAKLLGVRLYTIGAVPSDERQRGTVEVDEALMREMAESTGGRYFTASDETALRQIYAEIAQLERSRVGVRSQFASYDDVMLPLLLAGVLLVLLELLLSLTVLRRAP